MAIALFIASDIETDSAIDLSMVINVVTESEICTLSLIGLPIPNIFLISFVELPNTLFWKTLIWNTGNPKFIVSLIIFTINLSLSLNDEIDMDSSIDLIIPRSLTNE